VINHLQKKGIDLKIKSDADPEQAFSNEESKKVPLPSDTFNQTKNEKKRPSQGNN